MIVCTEFFRSKCQTLVDALKTTHVQRKTPLAQLSLAITKSMRKSLQRLGIMRGQRVREQIKKLIVNSPTTKRGDAMHTK